MDEELQQLEDLKNKLTLYLVENGVRILVALLIIVFAVWAGKGISRVVLKVCEKRNLDVTLSRFFAGSAKAVIIILAVIMALDKVHIQITPFIALLGAGAFGLSLAVQGPVSNYGAGVVLIMTRPFKVGDTITVGECSGVVDYVTLGNTQLLNEDDERITIPNRKILGETFTNSNEYFKVEGVVGIEYAADPDLAILKITEAIKTVDGIARDREPDVGIDAFGDSSINIGFRVMVPTTHLHAKRYALNLAVYHALKDANINIPFPQRDVHLIDRNKG